MGNNKDLYRNQKKVISSCNFLQLCMLLDCCKNDLQARKKSFFRNKLLHPTTG